MIFIPSETLNRRTKQMTSSSSSTSVSSQKPRIFRVDVDTNVYCYHDMVVVRRVAGSRSSREGHEFYGCPLWPRSDCKFFIWKQEVDETLSVRVNSNPLDLKNQALKMKITNLEIEKMMLEEENKNLKLKLAVSKFPIKAYVLGFLVVYIGFKWYFGH